MATEEKEVDFGNDEPTEQSVPLEDKYSQQMRQIVSQKIELPISTLPDMIKEQIDLSPDFQRRGRWDVERRSRFIESIIMNVPIPPVFLGEDEYGKYVVLDGRQRLTALYEFLQNAYELKGLGVWKELNGTRFLDLQKKKLERTNTTLDKIITRRFVPAVIILRESSPEVKYDVFDRLNTGGVIAEPMEIRNAVFEGEFRRLLHTLSDDQTFRKLWNIPLRDEERLTNGTYSDMGDLELVLRFFALRQYHDMNMVFRDYLSEFMSIRNLAYKEDPTLKDADTRLFKQAVENCWTVFGEEAFRRPLPDGQLRAQKSAPLADAVMVGLSDASPESLTHERSEQIRTAFRDLCLKDEKFLKSIGSGTNGRGAIKTRIEAVKAIVAHALAED
jgi:hypothetical protein